jgi:hypothetical protein
MEENDKKRRKKMVVKRDNQVVDVVCVSFGLVTGNRVRERKDFRIAFGWTVLE